MTLKDLIYWSSFVIPVVLLGLGAFIQKVVDGKPYCREHFYMGIDLTLYLLAATLVNFLDLAGKEPLNSLGVVWTVFLLVGTLVMLVIQMGIHQIWVPEGKRGGMQKFMMCYFSNGLGILLMYGFVKLKVGGLI